MSMIGKSLIHYEVTSQLGKGGMGEVYHAKDKKLGRDVAIKILPEEFARDADRVSRFQREAKLLASLNHPNIAAIHGLEESGGTNFLVMELIEGQTLADRIKTGPIPVEEALKLALQIAEALEAAHEKGVIHRDLKPANIKITPVGKIKILDFGLAKAFSDDQGEEKPLDSPTLSDAATRQGIILGTAAYMSPEQARGKPVDKRADIWAFGVILFEMLTGRTLFKGEDVSSTLARVLERDPDYSTLTPNLHPRIRFLLERCLEKEAKNRYRNISETRIELQKVLSDPSGIFLRDATLLKPRKKIRLGILWVAAITTLGIIIAGIAVWYLKPSEPRQVMRFSYELPDDQQFTSGIGLAVSPDGSQFVYRTTNGLYIRSVDALDARLINGTDQNSAQPVFSPNGQWIAYWSSNDQKLKKIAISGGVPVVLCDTGRDVFGLSWGPDNRIVYSDVVGGGVKGVSAEGGTPESIIDGDIAKISTSGFPALPQMLPDGKTLLFTNLVLAGTTDISKSQIAIQSLKSGERKVLVGGLEGRYFSTGHIIYTQLNNNVGSLVAVPFDLDTMEVKSGPVPLLLGIRGSAFSDSGTLVYLPELPGILESQNQAVSQAPGRKMVWVDFKGQETLIDMPPNLYRFPKISPDGTRVALTAFINDNPDIWIWDLERETLTRLTFDEGTDNVPIWSPDSKNIAFYSNRESIVSKGTHKGGIVLKHADGTGEVELLCQGSEGPVAPMCWSRDGKTLLFCQFIGDGYVNQDIAMLSMNEDKVLKPLLNESYFEVQPKLSPDGRWIVYCSNESGDTNGTEIYVRPFPEVNTGKWQVSTDGGSSPLWSPDGKKIFYLIGNTEGVMAVEVETEPTFKPGKPRLLFNGSYVGPVPSDGVPWDIHPDGKRFLMMKEPGVTTGESSAEKSPTEVPRKITIVLNWDEELKKRVPVN